MTVARDIDVVVFDVLGTLVDEPSGLRAGIREAVPASDEAMLDELLALWREHVEVEQQRIWRGERSYVSTEMIDQEAAHRVADRAGLADQSAIEHLATAGQRLPAWSDTLVGLDRLAGQLPIIGLSNASISTLLRLNAHAGLRWHQALSAEAAQAYKPAPEVYRLAVEAAGRSPERVLMVAAHAWDLRGAQAVGMRTAYVARPVGDPPTGSDTFDWHTTGLDELVTLLIGT
jgi:2-haloacid dehalogenase